ncbi:MAG TPA: crossover junction endodeoxyribonuclease RuvC [Candidatus Paceibacterota bacterium]|jgi:crossover junction endodeoxyribonuclease RuvC|nr:crossover junction endodeoxyribonuclease RuvC [Candidatus Paceibacterota bacterium]
MRLLAVDPGYDRCGVAVFEGNTLCYSTCIETNKSDSHPKRLSAVNTALSALIEEWRPEVLALETLFFSINKKTAIKVAEARGVIMQCAGAHHLHVLELSPQEVKLSMTGVGNADKKQVQKMTVLVLKIDDAGKRDDEIDAIALGAAAAQKWAVENSAKSLAKKK